MMQGDRNGSTPSCTIAQPPGADPDAAEVVEAGQSQCVPFKCFKGVLVIREGKASALDNEFKYFAYGVGQVLNEPRNKSRHEDYEVLINIIQLTPQGLAEAGIAALRIDDHAIHDFPKVFGHVTATRAG